MTTYPFLAEKYKLSLNQCAVSIFCLVQRKNPNPSMEKWSTGEICCVNHNHSETVDPEFYTRSELWKRVDKNVPKILSCIAFFKALAEDNRLSPAENALAASVIVEDECRLKEFQRYRPSSYAILIIV